MIHYKFIQALQGMKHYYEDEYQEGSIIHSNISEIMMNSTAKKKNNSSSCATNNGVVLKDKWKFVRNVMDNMERQKKMPLKDATNRYINKQHSETGVTDGKQSSFQQISQMFENFQKMRTNYSKGSNGSSLL